MSKTSRYILDNNIDVNPEPIDDSESEILKQAEAAQQQRDYERVVALGHPIDDLWF